MLVSVASEHIKDGTDCISEGIKNLKRVQKAYPNYADQLLRIQNELEASRSALLQFHNDEFRSID
jgi:hypothetical protein